MMCTKQSTKRVREWKEGEKEVGREGGREEEMGKEGIFDKLHRTQDGYTLLFAIYVQYELCVILEALVMFIIFCTVCMCTGSSCRCV